MESKERKKQHGKSHSKVIHTPHPPYKLYNMRKLEHEQLNKIVAQNCRYWCDARNDTRDKNCSLPSENGDKIS